MFNSSRFILFILLRVSIRLFLLASVIPIEHCDRECQSVCQSSLSMPLFKFNEDCRIKCRLIVCPRTLLREQNELIEKNDHLSCKSKCSILCYPLYLRIQMNARNALWTQCNNRCIGTFCLLFDLSDKSRPPVTAILFIDNQIEPLNKALCTDKCQSLCHSLFVEISNPRRNAFWSSCNRQCRKGVCDWNRAAKHSMNVAIQEKGFFEAQCSLDCWRFCHSVHTFTDEEIKELWWRKCNVKCRIEFCNLTATDARNLLSQETSPTPFKIFPKNQCYFRCRGKCEQMFAFVSDESKRNYSDICNVQCYRLFCLPSS
ncbi:hypothetical protein ACOME3_006080 [Neoechinorhynchus agilis]